MGLPMNLLKEFAKQVSSGEKKEQSTTYYGEVLSKTENEVTIQLDGSDVSTPSDCTMDAEVGDRVMVQIKDHKAVVVGNATSPASARTANAYMRLKDVGLVIGVLDNTGVPIGSACVIGNMIHDDEGYYIINAQGNIVAKFTDDEIDLGENENSKISLCSGVGYLEYSRFKGQAYAPSLSLNIESKEWNLDSKASIRAKQFWDEETSPLYALAEVAVNVPNGSIQQQNPSVDIEVGVGYDEGDVNPSESSAVYIRRNQILIYSNSLMLNNNNVVTANSVFYTNTKSIANGSISHSTHKKFTTAAVTVPSGYTLVGISKIETNHSYILSITGFEVDPSTKKLSVTLRNNSSSNDYSDINIDFKYFCIRSS